MTATLTPRLKTGRRRAIFGVVAFASFAFVGSAATALAQGQPDSRVAISILAAYQTNEPRMSQTVAFEQYSEQGSLTSVYTVGRRPVADLGVTVRLWRKLAVGFSATHFQDSGTARVNALVPNPFIFGQPRQLNGTASVSHTETGVNFQAAYWMQRGARLEIVVSGGPSVFRIGQDFVSDVAYEDVFPYDTVSYQGASVVRQHKSATGGNVGTEIGWRIARHLGIAGTARYSRASAAFPGTSASAIVVGGFHVGGGVRLLF
jgi:hypothetical protein